MRKKLLSILFAMSLTASALTGSVLTYGSAVEAVTEGVTEAAVASPITVTDQIGREVTLEKPAEKIVSCYYLVTSSLLALGENDRIVGIENGADARELYHLAAPEMLDLPGVGSGKEINIEAIADLEPDLVFLPKKQQDVAETLTDLGIPCLIVNPETFDTYNEMIELLGTVTGEANAAADLTSYYDDAVAELRDLTADVETRPSVYLRGSSSYLRAASGGMYQSSMIDIAGGTSVTEEIASDTWTDISPEQLADWNPDVIMNVSYSEFTLDDIRTDAALTDLTAVQNDALYTVPSQIEAWDYPQPSSILGLYWMTHVLHPELITEDQYLEKAQEFYKTYFDLDITADQL